MGTNFTDKKINKYCSTFNMPWTNKSESYKSESLDKVSTAYRDRWRSSEDNSKAKVFTIYNEYTEDNDMPFSIMNFKISFMKGSVVHQHWNSQSIPDQPAVLTLNW